MKKLITVALVIVMIFTLAVTAAAEEFDSPQPKETYSITISYSPADGSLGVASADKNQVIVDSEDDKVTLTADAKEGYFAMWDIKGEYEIIEGDLYSPVIVIKPLSDIKAEANFTIEEDYLNMFAKASGDGTASVEPARVKKGSNNTVTFTATDGKDTFSHWELECVYDIVEGDLSSRTLVVRPYTDIHATAYFTGKDTPTTPASSSASSGSSGSTSPKTGDPLYLIIGFAVLALGAGAFAIKKIKE